MSDNIKPCPCCGYEAFLESFPVRKGWEANIHCNSCLLSMATITYDTEEEAIEAAKKDWNKRTDAAGYRKQSNAEIDRIIREGKMKLNDAMRDSLNIAIGERNTDIAQAWRNGYDKGKSDTVKEFAEKATARIFEGITQRFCDCYNDGLHSEYPDRELSRNVLMAFDECKDIAKKEINELAAQYGKEEK